MPFFYAIIFTIFLLAKLEYIISFMAENAIVSFIPNIASGKLLFSKSELVARVASFSPSIVTKEASNKSLTRSKKISGISF